MALCPVCNGLDKIKQQCTSCESLMDDQGRYLDYFDDYSAYMPIDLMKMIDGISSDQQQNLCPHLVMCPTCNKDELIMIKEK
ncbi:hypothetical protein ACERII_08095 [Evansella sp. AB-rgal1]|uniref:hypothetical protein n=1 Tax=Evansella sp. AB-rgal1 TaxID=3242696 RepID=UPI00359CFE3A